MCPLILFTGKNVQKKNWRNKFQSHHNNKFRLLGCRCTFSKMKKRKASVEGKCFSFFLLNPIYLRGFISVVLWSQAKEYDHTRNAVTQTRCNQQHVRSLSGMFDNFTDSMNGNHHKKTFLYVCCKIHFLFSSLVKDI